MAADEEHDESELEQIEDDEMASDTGSCVDIVDILGEKVTDVSNLQDEQNNPRHKSTGNVLFEI